MLAAEMLVPILTARIPGNVSGIFTTAVACQSVTLLWFSEMEDTLQDFLTFFLI